MIGIDGIDIGKQQTSDYTKDPSDFCLVVYKRVYGLNEPQFVCIYKDRPNDIREAYKIAIKLALYYHASINIEATRQSLITYARDKGYIRLFMHRPRATMPDPTTRNTRQYGTPATSTIIMHQIDLIVNFVNDYCHNVWFEEMLDELSRYTDENKRKFDIVAAMGMALLADEELNGVAPLVERKKENTWQDFGYYRDEYGRTQYGIIPVQRNTIPVNDDFGQNLYGNTTVRTSDTRIYQGYLQG